VKPRALAIANDPVAEEAAQDYLLAAGSATGAVLAGFFASAGAYSGVLLGPLSIVVAGTGAGARAFDGRLRQPGLGTKRPRGFKADEPVPDAARVAVPTSFVAALVAAAYDGEKISSIMKSGVTRAQRAGAESRAGVLKLIRSVGAGAISDTSFVRPMLRAAGLSQGGLLTPSDFGSVPALDCEAATRKVGGVTLIEPPWAGDATDVDPAELGIGCAVMAIDVRGTFAALSYRRLSDGFSLEDLELEAPLSAIPVLRGVTRVAPGARLPAPAPIAIRRVDGEATAVIAAPFATRLGKAEVATPALSLERDPKTLEIVPSRR
jgi:gamma-glutamyltranspeptidase/glutathione hydrolase